MSHAEPQRLIVGEDADGQRVDRFLADHLPLSRNQLAAHVRDGLVAINGRVVARASLAVRHGQTVDVTPHTPDVPRAIAQDIPLDVVHEDADVIVINKPPGMVVHPAPGHPDGTLVNALLFHCRDLAGIGGTLRPGIVHRIDRDTSGLIVATKNDRAHTWLQAQFAAHTVQREYRALCAHTRGPALDDVVRFETMHRRHPNDRLRFTGNHGGDRHAVTHVSVITRFACHAVEVACTLETGRTHQIRMHLSEAGHPLLGDPLYGGRAAAMTRVITRTALHARVLGFVHPDGHELTFACEPPEDFERARERLARGLSWRL